jgi:hypothetical protein
MNVRQIGSRGADFFRTGNGRAQRCSGEAVYMLRVTGIRHAGLPRSRVTRFQCRLASVSIIAGWAIASYGLGIVIWLQALLMVAVPFAVMRVPAVSTKTDPEVVSREGIMALLRLPVFRNVVLVAALILGSHALHDTFSVIRWGLPASPP